MQELTALRRQTTQFIKEDPSSVVFSRNVKASDGAGGSTMNPTPLPAQLVKVVQSSGSGSGSTERRNQNGEVVSPQLVLVCEWDANIQKDDTFKWSDLACEVVWVIDLDYVKHAEVSVT